MQRWREPIDLGVVEFYWLAILQPKGFLKILEFFIAILTFSLTAGYVATATQECIVTNNVTNFVVSSYPFSQFQFTSHNGTTEQIDTGIGNGAQYFVAWGVFTLFYCIAAVIVYMLLSVKFLVNGLESLPDWLVLIDLVASIFWIFMWFIAFLVWAVESHLLRSAILNDFGIVNLCPANSSPGADYKTFAQIDISLTFSFLLMFVWICNLYFIVKDTKYYIEWSKRRADKYTPPPRAAEETY